MKNYLRYHSLAFILLFVTALFGTGCKKYLETKSVQTLAVPQNLSELQGLLDNPLMTNGPILNNTSTDEYYIGYTQYLSRPELTRKAYIWDGEIDNYTDWYLLYQGVYYANNVLFNLDYIEGAAADKQSIKGQALFFRSHAFFQLLQVFAPQYSDATADADLGIALRLDADFNKASVRSTVKACYQQLIKDLGEAAELLDNSIVYKNRPNKIACLGLLARVYLQMGDYSNALNYARQCQGLYNTIFDYNSIAKPYPTFPIPNLNNNKEILFYFRSEAPLNADYTRGARTDSNLVKLYSDDDLRKQLFFIKNADGSYSFRGQYTAESRTLFTGVATDEVLLISAECEARLNRPNEALVDLNKLLVNRYKTGTFVPYQNLTAAQALNLILIERRKQLLNRGIRWADLKRFNQIDQSGIAIRRNLNNTPYELSPNDKRYAFLIPQQVIRLSDMSQNSR